MWLYVNMFASYLTKKWAISLMIKISAISILYYSCTSFSILIISTMKKSVLEKKIPQIMSQLLQSQNSRNSLPFATNGHASDHVRLHTLYPLSWSPWIVVSYCVNITCQYHRLNRKNSSSQIINKDTTITIWYKAEIWYSFYLQNVEVRMILTPAPIYIDLCKSLSS